MSRLSQLHNLKPITLPVYGSGHVVALATHPNQIQIDGWCEACLQDICERSALGAELVVNPDFIGTWSGNPTIPPNWTNLNLDPGGEDTATQETADLPQGHPTGGYFKVTSGVEGLQASLTMVSGEYYICRFWAKVKSGTVVVGAATAQMEPDMIFSTITDAVWTRKRVCGKSTTTGAVTFYGGYSSGVAAEWRTTGLSVQKTHGIPVYLIGGAHGGYKVVDILTVASGFLSMDLTSNNGFLSIIGRDLSPYAGDDTGVTPRRYAAKIVDAAGKVCWVSLGAAGSGLAVTDILGGTNPALGDGDMELANITNWPAFNNATLAKVSNTKHGGTYSLIVKRNITNSPYTARDLLSVNSAYYVDAWTRGNDVRTPQIYNGTTLKYTGSTASATWYQMDKHYWTALAAEVRWSCPAISGEEYSLFDDVTIKLITEPAATGVHHFDSPTGTTRNYMSMDAGFDPYTACTVYIVDTQAHPQYPATLYWGQDVGGGVIKVWLDGIDSMAANETITEIVVPRNSLSLRSLRGVR